MSYRQRQKQQYTFTPRYSRYLALGITGGLLGTATYLEHAEAKGYRGNGYRPYNCLWREEYEKQAQEALANAKKFRKLLRKHSVSEEQRKAMGIAVLMDLGQMSKGIISLRDTMTDTSAILGGALFVIKEMITYVLGVGIEMTYKRRPMISET